MKIIVLVDSIWGGHHPTYFKIFAKTLLELGYEVIALSPEPEEVSQWVASHCPEFLDRFYSFDLPEPAISQIPYLQSHRWRKLYNTLLGLARWKILTKRIREIASKLDKTPDLVFFADLRSHGSQLGHLIFNRNIFLLNRETIFPIAWSGLNFCPAIRVPPKFSITRFAITKFDWLKRFQMFLSPYCKAMAILDEGVTSQVQSQLLGKPVIVFPDFTDESPPDLDYEISQKVYVKAAGRKIVGLLGMIDTGKGALILLEMSRQATDHWFFVFAGSLAEKGFTDEDLARFQLFIKEQPDNCFFHLTRIPDESQYNALVKVCDVVLNVRRNFPYSSNTLTKAALFQKPVIASKNYCIGERVEKFNLGYTVEEGNTTQCLEALERLYEQLATGYREIQPDFKGYSRLHSIEQLKVAFQTLLEYV
jgi:hypothetical protein